MLDRLFLKYLSKKGKIAYWVGQLILDALWIYYVFGIAGYSRDNGGESMVFIGILVVLVVWGAVCITLWRKKEEEEGG